MIGVPFSGSGFGGIVSVATDINVSSTTALRVRDGTTTEPLRIDTSGNIVILGAVGATETRMRSTATLGWSSGDPTSAGADVVTRRLAAQSLYIGAADSASPLGYTVTIGESSRGGTDTNVAGGNATYRSGVGTGNAAASSHIFQTPTVGASGTTAQTMATRMSITTDGVGIGVTPTSILHVQQAADAAGTTNPVAFDVNSVGAAGELTAASGVQTFARIAPRVNQSGTAGYTAFLVNATETAIGSGANNLVDLQVGGVSQVRVDNTGTFSAPNGVTWGQNGGVFNIGSSVQVTSGGQIAFPNNSGVLLFNGGSGGSIRVAAARDLTLDTLRGVVLTQSVQTSGSPTALTVTCGAHTTLAASTEATDANFNSARTVQFATGDLTTQRAVLIQAPTYGFVGASTVTNAATLAITGAPVAGTNATITNAYALWVDAGRTRFDDSVLIGATGVGTGAPTNVVVVANGTVPTSSPADSITLYSSDESAGNTIPSFYCEGSNVDQATGDVTAARLIRVRINGTIRTLMASS